MPLFLLKGIIKVIHTLDMKKRLGVGRLSILTKACVGSEAAYVQPF